MGTALVVISGLGTFISIGCFIISIVLTLIFSITKNQEKLKRVKKTTIISLIAFVVFLITFITVMIVAPKMDPVGWCSHEYKLIEQQEATCTTSGQIKKMCSLCDDEIIEIIEPCHLWIEEGVIEATCSHPKQIINKCTKCGITESIEEGSANHLWVQESVIEANCLHPKQHINKCTKCGITETVEEGSTTSHSFSDWVVSLAPTADKEGQKTRECTVCKHTESTNIPKITYIEVTANELWNAFAENEISAEQKYTNKTVRITGVISDINSADAFISANVLLRVDNSYFGCVQCNFNSKNAASIANLNKGDIVTIEGTCGTVSLYNLMVRSCKVIE